MEFKIWEITTEDENGDQNTWEVYESPTGQAVDPGGLHADQWYESTDDVEAYGLNVVVKTEPTDRTTVWSEEEIKKSVQDSARSYGAEAIPETLKHWLS